MSPRVVGIDLSLQSTGLADSHGNTLRVRTKATGGTLTADIDRLNRIAQSVADFVDLRDETVGTYNMADLVVVEGPSLGSTSGQQHTRGGLWWMAVDRIMRVEGDVIVVPPTTRAMYATGKGNAGKDEVLAAAIKRYPTFDITGNDVGDAVILAAIGMRMLGHPIDDLPKTHLRALTKLALPPER